MQHNSYDVMLATNLGFNYYPTVLGMAATCVRALIMFFETLQMGPGFEPWPQPPRNISKII